MLKINNNIYNKYIDWWMFNKDKIKKIDEEVFYNIFINNIIENNYKINFYFHYFFCRSSCVYCPYVHTFLDKTKEIQLRKNNDKILKDIDKLLFYLKKYWIDSKKIKVDTFSFGGGTPSYIPNKYIKEILEKISVNFNMKYLKEGTIEMNPTLEDYNNILPLKKYWINRISIWVQTFNKDITQKTGRWLKNKDVDEVIKKAIKDFDRVNIDMMYWLPDQTLEKLENDLERILTYKWITHISYYPLYLFENTYMYNNIDKYDNLPFISNNKEYNYDTLLRRWDIIYKKLSDKYNFYTMDYLQLKWSEDKWNHLYQLEYLKWKPLLPLWYWYWWSNKLFIFNDMWKIEYYNYIDYNAIYETQLLLNIRAMNILYNFENNSSLYKRYKPIIDIIKKSKKNKRYLKYQYYLQSYFSYLKGL